MIKFIKSFVFAFRGVFSLLKNERNFNVQLSIFIVVLIFAFTFNLRSVEWLSILGISALVLTLEAINTAIEKMANEIDSNYNEKIKVIKDISAGAVLIASLFSVIVGFIVFYPYFYKLIANL